MSRRARGVLGAAITLLLLWWVLRDVSPSSVWAELREANPWWLLAAVVLATFSFVLRAVRWRVLLEPGQAGSTFEARFGSTCTGFAANNIFPARLGEFIRAYVLSRVSSVPLGASVGSLVVERVLDGLVLASFLVGAILSPTFPLGDTEAAAWVERTAMVGLVVFAIGFFTMWIAARRPAGTLRAWEATGGRIVPERFADRATSLVTTLTNGFGALARFHVLARAVLWSLVVWICLGLSIWAGLLAFGITAPGFVGSMFLQAVIGFSVALPSTPGFFGVFEAGARIGLQPWGIGDAVIVSFATSYHILTFIPVTVLGLLYARKIGLRWGEARRRSDRAAPAGEGASAADRGGDGTIG